MAQQSATTATAKAAKVANDRAPKNAIHFLIFIISSPSFVSIFRILIAPNPSLIGAQAQHKRGQTQKKQSKRSKCGGAGGAEEEWPPNKGRNCKPQSRA
ncbi:hypothetical protein HBI56_217160 [Parastagonospora nodorum]|nr:hypothetical protein HBH54_167690 [Parastagonospora nodorum]KAH3955427.1 hypothetical protein HBH53_000510 [Parastagonospora nodorum]KAH3965651.1 hypothetical protein HBH52_204350 [Parastagonospora nodorum]KAH3971347.1 hypothetical protein HBH51_110060 [Parastagonospora nodorum]KAH4058095.1 hypothetical protein HBH49_028660 [Parastagonospora nodorum]